MRIFLTILTIVFSHTLFGQGFNNDQEYDKADLDFLFAKSGIEVFKFSFLSKLDSGLNIKIEEYTNHKLTRKIDFYNELKPIIAMGDEPLSFTFPKLSDSIKQTIRFYLTKTKDKLTATVKTDKIQTQYKFSLKEIKLTQTRAFDSIPQLINSKQPLFVFYGTKTGNMISCPGDDPVEKIAKTYDYVVAFYADILKP